MDKMFDLALGIVSAMGGFVDIGELIFLTQAGAKFYLSLLLVAIVGTVGIIVYGEMAGRLAAVSGYTAFKAVRLKLGKGVGGVALVSFVLVTLVTCTAELGGMALIMQLVTNWPFWLCAIIAAILVCAIVAIFPFSLIENVLGFFGLAMLVFLVAIFFDNRDSLMGLLEKSGSSLPMDGPRLLLYAYFAVGILTSSMMPYELAFYASGAIEDEWTSKELMINRLIVGIGFSFGFFVAAALLVNAASKLIPRGIDPQLIGASALESILPFGWWGGALALFGMFFAVTGAAVETSMSVGYAVCQFFDRPWGKSKPPAEAPLFNGLWLGTVVVGLIAVLIYQQPLQIAELAVVFSVLALPLAYLAVFLAASDHRIMGMHMNGKAARIFGVIFIAILTITATAAIPLLIATGAGQIW